MVSAIKPRAFAAVEVGPQLAGGTLTAMAVSEYRGGEEILVTILIFAT